MAVQCAGALVCAPLNRASADAPSLRQLCRHANVPYDRRRKQAVIAGLLDSAIQQAGLAEALVEADEAAGSELAASFWQDLLRSEGTDPPLWQSNVQERLAALSLHHASPDAPSLRQLCRHANVPYNRRSKEEVIAGLLDSAIQQAVPCRGTCGSR